MSIAFGSDTNMPHNQPLFTALQSFILRTIHRLGPQSEMGLWHNAKHEPVAAVLSAVATLASSGYIEPTPLQKSPRGSYPGVTYWQLTKKAEDHIAGAGAAEVSNAPQQEVSLGSK